MKPTTLLLALLASISPALAADWPQWRGANRDDISTETGLQKKWPSNGPKRAWLNEDGGLGYAGFAVVGDKLYTMGLYDAEEKLICLDANTGKKIWDVTVGALYKNGWGDGPRSTPANTSRSAHSCRCNTSSSGSLSITSNGARAIAVYARSAIV